MTPIDENIAHYVTRETAPDGRTVLDLVWCFEPGDFRELGGERRARVYDAVSGATVLSLLNRQGPVRSHGWDEDGALRLTFANGAGLRLSLGDGTWSTLAEPERVRSLADIQRDAPPALGLAKVVEQLN